MYVWNECRLIKAHLPTVSMATALLFSGNSLAMFSEESAEADLSQIPLSCRAEPGLGFPGIYVNMVAAVLTVAGHVPLAPTA